MSSSQHSIGRRAPEAAKTVGAAEVMSVGVRVAGRVPTRADLRFAGTPEQILGLTLGTVLIYLNSALVARTVALAWGQAAPVARSLSPVLPVGRRPVLATGPWSLTTMVRLFAAPSVDTMLLPARPGGGSADDASDAGRSADIGSGIGLVFGQLIGWIGVACVASSLIGISIRQVSRNRDQ